MWTPDFLTFLHREGHSLLTAAENAGWDTEVPTCPGWRVRDLVRHQGLVYRRATRYLTEPLLAPVPLGEDETSDEALPRWFEEGHTRLVRTLAQAPEDLVCWTFLAGEGSGRAFWARRQTHETTIHRVDAELAEGVTPSPVSEAVARDGIDELLSGSHTREHDRVRTEKTRTLRVRTTDGEHSRTWLVRLSAHPPQVIENAEGPVDCELSGPAELLYLALWNRLPQESGLTVRGDAELLAYWRAKSTGRA